MLTNKKEKIDEVIHDYYNNQTPVSTDLIEAILYSVDGGGKRIRPMLMLEIITGFGFELTRAHYDVAAALEMIHTGSLIHDDLPAMDNDDYRRGQLTNHKKFDEATAILAGDSLFLDAAGLIAETELSADIKVSLIQYLSHASGTFGMVGGQMLDMKGQLKSLTLEDIQKIHANKTGALLAYPFFAAGILANQEDEVISDLVQAGLLFGIAFQIRDDILDVTADFDQIGKTPQKDVTSGKSTYPDLLGLKESYEMLNHALDQVVMIFKNLQDNNHFKPHAIISIIERLRLNG